MLVILIILSSRQLPTFCSSPLSTLHSAHAALAPKIWNSTDVYLSCTGVNPAGDAGDTSPIFWLGDVNGNIPQYYYVLSDIADQYWLPSVRSTSSRFHSAIRLHQFASVRQADSRLTRLVPPTLNSRWRHCCHDTFHHSLKTHYLQQVSQSTSLFFLCALDSSFCRPLCAFLNTITY